MAQKNNNFFAEKKDWSVVKDELLACYFKPYVSKILNTYKPLIYVDCFAGKGKFEDGSDGSPRIALEIIPSKYEKTAPNAINKAIIMVFLIFLSGCIFYHLFIVILYIFADFCYNGYIDSKRKD